MTLIAGAERVFSAIEANGAILIQDEKGSAFALVGKESTMNNPQRRARRSRRCTATGKEPEGFMDQERAAMRERAEELKAVARRGGRANKADGENDVLAKIAEMQKPDRAMAERLHANIKTNAPGLAPRTWYGMPAMQRTAISFAFSKARRSSRRDTRHWASATRRSSTKATCGRSPTR
jgi:hypothetical protein